MTLYETIFKRRSVRSYSMQSLNESTLTGLREFLDGAKSMDGQNARFEIVSGDKVKNDTAPHYILAYCDKSDSTYANVGFLLENADLYLQSKGLGSLWLGMAKPSEQDGDFCIMMAFGKTDVPMRKDAGDFKRLPLGDISDTDNAVAQAARLAPSAMNSQPWKLCFSEGKVTVRYHGRGVSQFMLKPRLSKIDLGIITRHVETALQSEDKTVLSVKPITAEKDFAVELCYQ